MQFTVIFFTVLRKKGDFNKIKQPSSAFSKRISLRNPPTAFVEYLVTGKPAQEGMDFFVNKLG